MGVEQPLIPGWTSRSVRWLAHRHAKPAQTDSRQLMPAVVIGVGLLVCVAMLLVFRRWPDTSYALFAPLLLAVGALVRGRAMAICLAILTVTFVLVAFVMPSHTLMRAYSSAIGLAGMAVVLVALDRVWSRSAGVSARAASNLLSDLRHRHEVQTHMPDLPAGWEIDSAVVAAHGESLCGDIVAGCEVDGVFHAIVLDVSGKGSTAASRALLLGGAASGLLGAVPAERVLPALNDYLVRQGWSDGFATATYLSVDLTTGEYSLASAGHPAAIQFRAGKGNWQPLYANSGVVLGILEGLGLDAYPRLHGRLESGDMLMLYSDGVVEHKDIDIPQGVDRMLGVAEREIPRQFAGAAGRICAEARAGESDDRTVVILRRH
ncbi:serine/threonine-protein phosphatase [Yimella sp. cx-573]|nr:serine/threonine-protein phosphatase [Yimella sp. cx-573]